MILFVCFFTLFAQGHAQTTLFLMNGDVTNDHTIDDGDLLQVLFDFGSSNPSDPDSDLNGDGIVNDADLLIVQFNFGQTGADDLTGDTPPQERPYQLGAKVVLSQWAGAPQQPVQVRAKQQGGSVLYTQTVSSDVVFSLEVEQPGLYLVQAKAAHWLNGQWILPTAPPYVFAAPTGANKVTVYWDPVPGATGYRVRWGTISGQYTQNSAVLSGTTPYRYHVTGLTTEQEYYFVVEAAYQNVFSLPSEEDSAIPHAGAIPWDTQDPGQIISTIRSIIDYPFGDIEVLSPDDIYYASENGITSAGTPPTFHNANEGTLETVAGLVIVPTTSEPIEGAANCTSTGTYRRIRSSLESQGIGAKGQFWLPPPSGTYAGLYTNPSDSVRNSTQQGTRDAPHIYFGVAFGKQDLEGGVFYMPANWGQLTTQGPNRGQEISMPGYNRWIPYLKALPGRKGPPNIADQYKFVGDPNKPGNHIRYDNNLGAQYGLIIEIQLLPKGKEKIATVRIKAWEGSEDGVGDPLFDKPLVTAAKDPKRNIPTQGVRVRRMASIAQVSRNVSTDGYKRTGSFLGTSQRPVGVGVVPIITGIPLEEARLYRQNIGFQLWIPSLTDEVRNCPPTGVVGATFNQQERWYRERIWIDLR